MARVTSFEIHASDPIQLMEFYKTLFDWKFEKWPSFDYWAITTGTTDEPGINGGLLKRPTSPPSPVAAINAYICSVQVGSIDDIVQKALDLGSILALPKMAIPGLGWVAYIKDLDGNILGLQQIDPTAA
jgi:uncharacterized protein